MTRLPRSIRSGFIGCAIALVKGNIHPIESSKESNGVASFMKGIQSERAENSSPDRVPHQISGKRRCCHHRRHVESIQGLFA